MDPKTDMERAVDRLEAKLNEKKHEVEVSERKQERKVDAKKADDKHKPTPGELRRQLTEREVRINRRVDAIKGEVLTTGDDVQRAVFGHPLVSVGGSLVAGLVVGLLLGGKNKEPEGLDKALRYLPGEQRRLAEDYAKAVEKAARRAAKRGEDVGDAVRAFLTAHAPPVIVTQGGGTMTEGNVFKQSLDTAIKTALGFAVKAAIDKVMVSTGLAEMSPALAKTVHGGATDVAAAAAATS